MKKYLLVVLILLFTSVFFIEAQTLSGKWISHQFPATQFSPPLIRCGGNVGVFSHYNTGTISFFDANNGLWTDKILKVGEYVIDIYAAQNTAFAYTSDSLLIAYSSLTHRLDSIKYQGLRLGSFNLWQCGDNLIAFTTNQFFYVFDAIDGIWHALNISLPIDFQTARLIMGSDYVLLIIYRNWDDRPKHYVYSLHHHSFNQLDYGPLPNEMMDHGYAGSITTPLDQKKLIGYSAISNEFSETLAPFGLGKYQEAGPHHKGGSIYAYCYSEPIIPDYQWRTSFYVFSTLSGQWFHDVFDYLITVGYGNLLVGSEYVQITKQDELALNLFSSNPLVWSSYNNLFYQFYPDFRTISGTQYPPSAFILGQNVFAMIMANKGWGYNAVTNLDNTCTISGSVSSMFSNIFEGKDYLAFGIYESNKDSMDLYIYDGSDWINLICGNYGSGATSVGTDELYGVYSFYQHSYKIEIIVYSKSLGYSIQYPLPYQSNYLGAYAKGCLLEINTSGGNFIFDSQTLIPYQFGFHLYSDWISDSIAVLYDNSSHQIYGYSTKTKSWANTNTTANINFNDIGTNVGLLTAGNNREKVFAYNGIYGTWVPLLPESKSIAYEGGDNFAVVFKEGMAYAFFTERNGPAIISTTLTSNVNAGSQTLAVAGTDGLLVGDKIIINPGGQNEEQNIISGFGSILLQTPLQFDHYAGELVIKFTPTSVEENDFTLPSTFELYQNYPNPFNPSTKIRYTIPTPTLNPFSKGEETFVQLKVYDVLGNEVATLVNEEQRAGTYEVEFNVAHESVRAITSGVYFYQLKAGEYKATKKMLLLK